MTAPQLLLQHLPDDLLFCVADLVDDACDRAVLRLALRPIALAPRRVPNRYQEVALAQALLLSQSPVDERVFRRYVCDRRATYDGILWLNRRAAEAGVAWHVRVRPPVCSHTYYGIVIRERFDPIVDAGLEWDLIKLDEVTRLRRNDSMDNADRFYEGPASHERLTSWVDASGTVAHYEGDRGAERVVREVRPDGTVYHFEGERNWEYLVRVDYVDGGVDRYVYEDGAPGMDSRRVRAEYANGKVKHFAMKRNASGKFEMADGTMRTYLLCHAIPLLLCALTAGWLAGWLAAGVIAGCWIPPWMASCCWLSSTCGVTAHVVLRDQSLYVRDQSLM